MDSIFSQMGKGLFIIGVVIALAGVLLMISPKIPYFGKLPGDIHIEREHLHIYFPLTTCFILSALAWIVMRLFR